MKQRQIERKSKEPTFRGKPLGEGLLIKYLGRKGSIFQFEVGKWVHDIDHNEKVSLMKDTVRIKVLKGFGVHITIDKLSNPQMSYFGRREVEVASEETTVMLGIHCNASFQSMDIGQEKIEVKIKDQ